MIITIYHKWSIAWQPPKHVKYAYVVDTTHSYQKHHPGVSTTDRPFCARPEDHTSIHSNTSWVTQAIITPAHVRRIREGIQLYITYNGDEDTTKRVHGGSRGKVS